jgi:hypothetical protein
VLQFINVSPQARFTSGDNIVVDITNYNLGCSGTWQGQSWSASRCGTAELFGWMEAAKAYTQNVRVYSM